MEERIRDFYVLKGDLKEVQLEPGSTRLVLVFDKKSDPQLSLRRLQALRGFVICSIKGKKTSETDQDEMLEQAVAQARLS